MLNLIIQNDKVILSIDKEVFLTDTHILDMKPHFLRYFSLGVFNNIEYFVGELNTNFDCCKFIQTPLKQTLSLIQPDQYAICTKAYSIIRWDNSHQFCGYCSSPTIQVEQQFERICTICKSSFFPRISPSIIVLIYKDSKLIMARSPHFPPDVYGLIAGFVDAGESLEEAIHREVKEEVGLQVKNITYFGSQSWPFPDSLMIAFTAEYDSGDIVIDSSEIEEASWYSYDNLPGRPSMSISIASTLLDTFVHDCIDKYGEKNKYT